jgi:hypothetical protein
MKQRPLDFVYRAFELACTIEGLLLSMTQIAFGETMARKYNFFFEFLESILASSYSFGF